MGAPPAFLQLAGHPLRWQLLTALARSDHRVHELTATVDQPQNLVSYHLGKLRAAGLVSSRRSSADGRDSYYTVDLARVGSMLAGTASALHPGLAPARPAPAGADAKVLFLCTGNSARSRMAEALAVHRSAGAVHARSAGSHPKPLHPEAARVMRDRFGIELDGPPTHLDELAGERFDRVATLCDRVREVCPEWAGATAVHWSLADPSVHAAADDTHRAFEQLATDLDARVGFLLAELAASPTTA